MSDSKKSYLHELDRFIESFPDYSSTEILDEVRVREFARLDKNEHTYLDYTGAALYSEKLLRAHYEILENSVLGNPHSNSPSSQLSTHMIESARERILDYIGDYARNYEVIFTANATEAIKLIAESFPFDSHSKLLLSEDSHNSVHGIRSFACLQGAATSYLSVSYPELKLSSEEVDYCLDNRHNSKSLFSIPAQSNLSGTKHDLNYISIAQERGWYTLLDAAAYLPTNNIDINRCPVDFMCISFYKMFGFPTGVGCLIAKKSSLQILNPPSFYGGSTVLVGVQKQLHILASPPECFEHGTPNFSSIFHISSGLDWLEAIGADTIQKRIMSLTGWMISQFSVLKHSNSSNLIQLYGPSSLKNRGATLSFHLVDKEGKFWNSQSIEHSAFRENISIRVGYHCNPGSIERISRLSESDLEYIFDGNSSNEEVSIRANDLMPGVIRISLGPINNFSDVFKVVQFFSQFIDKKRDDGAFY